MRVLVIDDVAKRKVAAVREYAEKRENWYLLGPGVQPKTKCPGDIPAHVCMLNTYRCVFSWTREANGNVWRDLSVSVPAAEKYPNPAAFFEIANLFGLVGENPETTHIPLDWEIFPNRKEHCIRAAQKVDPDRIPQ